MPKTSGRSAKRKAPWKKSAPKGGRHTRLSSADRSKARRAAKRAGRRCPNLVDNMRVAGAKRSSGRTKAAKPKAAKRKPAKRKPAAKQKPANRRRS
jgi:hypothetical protein